MITKIFDSIPDHRVTGRCIYRLGDLLSIALLTFICNGEDYQDMSEFAATRARDFGLFADCGDHSPSPDTFERLMAAVSPDEIERCLLQSGRALLDSLAEKQVVIDGKKLRGASPRSLGNKGLYLMNAFVSENHIMVAQETVQDKENEIVAIPRVLDKIDLEGAVVSIDAIGTQVDIAQQIRDKGANYLLSVKANQGSLLEAVVDTFKFGKAKDSSSEMEADHGRIEERACRIIDASLMEDRETAERWPGLKTLVEVTSTVTPKSGMPTQTTRYFISDEDFPRASYYAMLVRGHWGIENQLHWQLDVTFSEDASRARRGFASQNLSSIRKLAMQVIKGQNDKRSLKKRRFRATLSNDYLTEMLIKAKF